MADTVKTAIDSGTSIAAILDTIKWPLIIIIIIIIFQQQLKSLLSRITGIKAMGASFEALPSTQQNAPTQADKKNIGVSPVPVKTAGEGTVNVDKWLSIYSEDTIKRTKEWVKTETGIANENDAANSPELIYNYAMALYLVVQFDRMYRYIFGSQIKMLDFLNSNFTATKESLKTFYDQAAAANPTTFASYTYDSYLDYLYKNNLIYNNALNVNVTWMGRDFLKFLTDNGYQKSLPY